MKHLATALSTLVVAGLPWLVGFLSPRTPLTRGQEPASFPSSPSLLRSPPFDRITLTDGTTLLTEPIHPRPLPPLENPREKRELRAKVGKVEIPLEGNIGLPGQPEARKSAGAELQSSSADAADATVRIHLLEEADVRDFTVKRSSIRSVEYFEDMLLAEGERLIQARDYTRAFECFLRVRLRDPRWPGLEEQVDRLLFAEGSRALLDGREDRGVMLLRELLDRRPEFPGLIDQLAAAYRGRIRRAIDQGRFAEGRGLLRELSKIAAEHPVVREQRERLIELATQRLKAAESLPDAERLDSLAEAVSIWPKLDSAEAAYRRSFEAMPTLDVAVDDVPAPLGPWVHSPADDRVVRLIYRPILSGDPPPESAGQLRDPAPIASALQSSDLGRRLALQVSPLFHWSDGSRTVSAPDVARSLIDRCDPYSPSYQARWADLLDRVEVADESRVELRLNRPLLKPASWLSAPVGPAHAGPDGKVAAPEGGRTLVTNGPFRCIHTSASRLELRAGETKATTSPGSLRVRRVREFRLSDGMSAMTALLEGAVSLAAHIPADQVPALAQQPVIRVGKFAQPALHLIALDGRNPILRNRSLRRGLSYAINRRGILENHILKRPPDDRNLVADGPFPRGSYADAPDVRPFDHDVRLAVMLVAAARKELGHPSLHLDLEYPAIPEARIGAAAVAEAFRLAGVEIRLLERGETSLERELRSGRRFDLAYRVVRCVEPMLEAGPLLCPGYDAPPQADALSSLTSPRIRQLLLELERAPELATARGLALQIDRESRSELPVLPLWQLDDHYAWRTRLQGPAPQADHLYQGIESWEIAPWIPTDPSE